MHRMLVAIVGRPNVGKSTLFNRILGHRDAIVHDHPGVTRDRHYADAEWAGRSFTLIDTGGFVPASDDVIEIAVREQAQVAIEEADLVLFVVDATTGPLPTDAEIASVLRKAAKRVVTIVNKVDSDAREYAVSEFFSLGLGTPVPASALLGRKIGDLLDEVTAGMEDRGGADEDDGRLKLAIIGRPNVGKSSLVNALVQRDRHIVTDIPGTTRDPIDTVLTYQGQDIVLVDTAGLRRKSKIKESIEFFSTLRTLKSIDRCDVAIVLLDATQGLEHQDLHVVDAALERKRPMVIAVNKWDLVEKDNKTADAYAKALRERLRAYDYVPILFISAVVRQRIYKVIDIAKAVHAESQRRIQTSELNDALLPEIERYPPRTRSGKELKIKFITQVRTAPPVFAFFCNLPEQIEENYRRFLENRLRERYPFTGVPVTLVFKKK
jgi:GTP-binding protein